MSINEQKLVHLITSADFDVEDRREVPAHPADLRPVPDSLHPLVSSILQRSYPSGLYKHQSGAIESALKGEDVVLASATASGKSLPYMAVAAHLTMLKDRATIMALYPARALIQDQLTKWRDFLGPLDIPFTYIDGGVPVADRLERLGRAQVALLTPDVAHAWLMSHLYETTVRDFLARLKLLILDEAHVYEGAFGTNMAFLLRRLQVASGHHQLICSTATLGQPTNFVEQLTGRQAVAFGPEEDGAPAPGKTILLASPRGRPFDTTVSLLRKVADSHIGRFLAFADSRRQVEQFVAATVRSGREDEPPVDTAIRVDGTLSERTSDDADDPPAAASDLLTQVLPYRAGYERGDREKIQESLALGELAGVVATSALELGLDIGDIELVLLLDVPLSAKSFWQRIGRAGRRTAAICVVLDPKNVLAGSAGGLDGYMARPIEPNWLYLENRYIQYAHALCAAVELSQLGIDIADLEAFQSVPENFRKLLENELHPAGVVPPDLYPLKQRAQDDPHHEFAIRGAAEHDLKIIGPGDQALGSVTYSQALREAYPGSVYYYMARPYRVWRIDNHRGEIRVKRERSYTTMPISQTKVFPRFEGGTQYLLRSERGFVAEVEMQVSERVVGFSERRGSIRVQNDYGAGSTYSQRPLTRFFETTGVCWSFRDTTHMTEEAARKLLEAFAMTFGVQERDLGVGVFYTKTSPLGPGELKDLCIYDATAGSLRLTQMLAEHFSEAVDAARDSVTDEDEVELAVQLQAVAKAAVTLETVARSQFEVEAASTDEDWVILVAPGETAILQNAEGSREVEIVTYRYTPRGLRYELRHRFKTVTYTVPFETVQPVVGETRLIRVNLVTGEEIEI